MHMPWCPCQLIIWIVLLYFNERYWILFLWQTNTTIYHDVFSCVPNDLICSRYYFMLQLSYYISCYFLLDNIKYLHICFPAKHQLVQRRKFGIQPSIQELLLRSWRPIRMETSKTRIQWRDYSQWEVNLFLFLWVFCAMRIWDRVSSKVNSKHLKCSTKLYMFVNSKVVHMHYYTTTLMLMNMSSICNSIKE